MVHRTDILIFIYQNLLFFEIFKTENQLRFLPWQPELRLVHCN